MKKNIYQVRIEMRIEMGGSTGLVAQQNKDEREERGYQSQKSRRGNIGKLRARVIYVF